MNESSAKPLAIEGLKMKHKTRQKNNHVKYKIKVKSVH